MSREKIQKAFGDAAKKMTELVKHNEQHGAELTDAEFAKGFAFLQATLDTVREQSRAARALNVAASGKFSFDMEIPVANVINAPQIAQVAPVRPTTGVLAPRPVEPRPVGRIVKDAEAAGNEAGQVLFDIPQPVAPLIKPDPQGDVDFFEE